MAENPQVAASKTVFRGHVFDVRVDTLLAPDGRMYERDVVRHPGAVAIAPIDADDNVLLVRQYRHPVERSLLEIPAGVVEEGESPDDTAQRELQEEVGYASRDLRALGGIYASPGFCDEFLYLYTARDLIPSRLPGDEDEDISVERVPMSRIGRLIRLGEIQDAKSVACLLMALHLFKR